MMFLDMEAAQELCLSNPILALEWRDRDPFALISAIMIKFEEGVDPAAFVRQVEESGMETRCVITGDTIAAMQESFRLSTSVWTTELAAFCGITGVVLAVSLGFLAAVSPAVKSASMDPQAAITQGSVN